MANNLRAIRNALGLTQPTLAERMGTTKNQLIKLEAGDRRLTQDWIEKAANATGVAVELFVKEGFEPVMLSATPAATHRVPLTDRPQRGGQPDLAVRGIAMGGSEGEGDFQLNGNALDYIPRPAGLIGRPNAFAVILRNTSMEPVYKHGWPIFVDPDGRKPVEGEDVLLELFGDDPDDRDNGPAFIKTLVRQRGGQIIVSQYNPAKELNFDASRKKNLYRVIPYPEAMGLAV
ncbi:helix-turn-helix domain-containing protein [Bosea sp. (in: a-proteobacteria)]|uniref:LexA family transcriptional regulator n=1 Tax=Bosea sp. (in: a-proteobacteria) TaxID=1871050 RepID=UPI0026106260|nr:helix-turn-helix domain-containing protein [Bosea sp. (in: a-proteobacteria)]MCO5092031.1 helix-turn-helix domain-containing protein [Bosea sp. (in: a-proteobacteria)]